ncbi:4'-phosphopantetheinyl transferase family protein [Paracoccus aestuariivivens]|uniref:4-phosphopantetheinyl transferase n=1 Tax=Paracoccus aestuariivivens TaxID=1820333 RepID=A0A6L6JAU7_9RHOB|nr:4'-phosphopantetheinyl transferase superfamily protein [Paracoccus aestuariivivens]MTH77819.1 4-phosphopantetheinyl transferase [Paracoccus aestuariivivens]
MSDAGSVEALARRLMPQGFGCAVVRLSEPAPDLLPEERAMIARAVPKRRHEFALGRHALRLALADAGHDLPSGHPLVSLPDRRPALPQGIRASLAHGGEFCVAIAAPPGGPSVGVDIEAAQHALPETLAETVAPYRMKEDAPLLAFCVKEAMFKAQYPLTGRMLDFCDVPTVIRGARVRGCLGKRLIGARWGQVAGHYIAVSLWRG